MAIEALPISSLPTARAKSTNRSQRRLRARGGSGSVRLAGEPIRANSRARSGVRRKSGRGREETASESPESSLCSLSCPKQAPPLFQKECGRWSDGAIPPTTAVSLSRSGRPASTAGRAASRVRRSARTSCSSRPPKRRSRRATAPASAAGPTGSARRTRGSRRCAAPAKKSRRPRSRRGSRTSPRKRP